MPLPKKVTRSPKPRKSKQRMFGKINREVDVINCDGFSNMSLKEKSSTETGLVYDDRMVEHRCLFDPEYPECPERFSRSLQRCTEYGLIDRCKRIPSRSATYEEISSQHSAELIEILKSTKDCEDQRFTEELASHYDAIYFHPSTYELSLLAAGCTIDLVTQIAQGNLKNGMAIVRPPGHHAMRDKLCGYCYFNNVAIAAKHAITHLGLKRILIVDWDVHHGQATQYAFYDDPRILYFSIHRYEHGAFWPELRESNYDYIGEGRGKGYNFNVPLNKVGMGNSEYLAIFHQLLLPVAYEYSPQLVIVSAGYDAAIGCREGKMEVTPACYAHLTSLLMTLANGKVCAVLEGGYCLKSLAEGVALTLRTLLGDPCPLIGPTLEPDESCIETILNVISVHRPFWKCFSFQGTTETQPSSEGNSFHYDNNEWPDHVPSLKYDGTPPSTVFPIMGFYPTQSPEEIAEFDRRIDELIAKTDLTVQPNRTCLVYDRNMTSHCNFYEPSHPEKPGRLEAVLSGFQEHGLFERCKILDSRSATEEELQLCHGSVFIEEMKRLAFMKNKELAQFAEKFRSIYFCRDTFNCALLAAGCVLQAVDEILSGKSRNGAAVVRPPGHHAEKDEACGFCIFNNVAVAAKYALTKYNLSRILILDWDIHHGNGIQSAFEDDPRVLYISIHRYNNGEFFPSWVEANHTFVGVGAGEGFNINIPWNTLGLEDMDYLTAFIQVVLPVCYQYDPELVLVSAGFDAAKGDFLGNCKVTPVGYSHMTHLLSGLANGKLLLTLEGGYNFASISASFAACVKVLLGDPCPALPVGLKASKTAVKSISNVLTTHKKYWSCLKYQVNLPDNEVGKSEVLEGAVGGCEQDSTSGTNDLTSLFVSLKVSGDDDFEGPYAVIPKNNCPHLESVMSLREPSSLIVTTPCSACYSAVDNWICLSCYEVFCGRSINSHMIDHHRCRNDHCIVLGFSDLSIWCYKCDCYIDDDTILGPIKDAAHLSKFGEPSPAALKATFKIQ